jgi:hypothetical protein
LPLLVLRKKPTLPSTSPPRVLVTRHRMNAKEQTIKNIKKKEEKEHNKKVAGG